MNAIRSADHDDTMLRPLTKETFAELLKEIPKGKALDSLGLSIEHILLADQSIIDLLMELLNTIIVDLDWASHPLINLGIATMLYKGKGKPLDDPTSFRRIQISCLYMKLLQRLTVYHSGKITEKHALPTQYGFRKNVSFLQNSILRDTLCRNSYFKKTKMYKLSTDISNAFCCTLRWIQLFQLSACGEKGKLLKFSKAVYSNTNFFIKGENNETSPIIGEKRGGTQGALTTPPHFSTYTLPLQNAIENANIQIEIEGVKINTSATADDQVNEAKDKTDFMVLNDLYKWYHEIYKLSFGWNKTVVQVYGVENPNDHMDGITFGDCSLKTSDQFTHLGIECTQDILNVANVNVTKRLTKFKDLMWATLGNAFKDKKQISFKCIKNVMTTMLIPTLLSGLSPLCIPLTKTKRLDDRIKQIWRRIFSLSEYSTINVLIWISGVPLPSITLILNMLSLFWNVWQHESPCKTLCINILKNKPGRCVLDQYHTKYL